jgi:hypothetical protein
MRIWDVSPERLCRNHLLGEHRELHALWNILTQGKKGYANHPETLRWRGKLKALFLRHEALAAEMKARGYHHKSFLDPDLAVGESIQRDKIQTYEEQVRLLRKKKCSCRL